MEIHVVQPGDTLFRLSRQYNLPMERLIQDNQLPNPAQLVVGQALVLRFPALTHVVREGDTLSSLSQSYQVPAVQLLRNNPSLEGRDRLTLCVYEQNGGAVRFYSREGFSVERRGTDSATGEAEFWMSWER